MDDWAFRQAPNGPGFWEHTAVPRFEEPPIPRLIGAPQRGRDRKGRFRTGPQGFMDDADVLAYAQGSDVTRAFDDTCDEEILAYWSDEVKPWIPVL